MVSCSGSRQVFDGKPPHVRIVVGEQQKPTDPRLLGRVLAPLDGWPSSINGKSGSLPRSHRIATWSSNADADMWRKRSAGTVWLSDNVPGIDISQSRVDPTQAICRVQSRLDEHPVAELAFSIVAGWHGGVARSSAVPCTFRSHRFSGPCDES